MEYAEALKPDHIFILSAKDGLLEPYRKVSPYGETLNDMGVRDRRKWAGRVLDQIKIMLKHPTVEKLYAMKLFGMAKTFKEQMNQLEAEGLSFEDRFALLVDQEMNERENRRLRLRLENARFKMSACAEDIDYRSPRGLDKALLMRLFDCDWAGPRRTSSSSVRQARGKPSSRARWGRRRAGKAMPSCTGACSVS